MKKDGKSISEIKVYIDSQIANARPDGGYYTYEEAKLTEEARKTMRDRLYPVIQSEDF